MIPIKPEDIRLLTEVGFLAGARGDLRAACTIFAALEACRPNAAFPYIGLAMALLNLRLHDEAVRVLDRGLKLVDAADQADIKATRALALRLAGRGTESDRAVQAAGNHPMALAMSAPARMF